MILVVGATGQLGRLIAGNLLARGDQVRALLRDGSSGEGLIAAGAQPVAGDLKDPSSLRRACQGVHAVITTANAVGRGGDDTVDAVDARGNIALIDAAAVAGVTRFVFTSALGAAPDHPSPLLRAKGEAEQRLRASAMAWTVLQPNAFMDTWVAAIVGGPALAGQPVPLIGEGRRRHSLVAMCDVASYAVAALDHEEATDHTLYIGGPEPVSWRDVVAAFEQELGRPLPVRTVAPGEAIPGIPPAVGEVLAAMDTYDSPLDMTALAATYGVTPTPLAKFVRELLHGRD